MILQVLIGFLAGWVPNSILMEWAPGQGPGRGPGTAAATGAETVTATESEPAPQIERRWLSITSDG